MKIVFKSKGHIVTLLEKIVMFPEKMQADNFFFFLYLLGFGGLPRCLSGKEFTCQAGDQAGDPGLIPELERSGERKGNSFQYSCLGNPMDRGAWQATVHAVASQM